MHNMINNNMRARAGRCQDTAPCGSKVESAEKCIICLSSYSIRRPADAAHPL